MKSIVLSVVFTVMCSIGFTQTKKPGNTKKTNIDSITSNLLKQEKIWPVYYKPLQYNNSIVIKSPAGTSTYRKL